MKRARPNITGAGAPPADPVHPEEWQEAVDAAKALLALEAARLYGLVTGGPVVNVRRCEEILDQGRTLGYVPSADAVERFILTYNQEAQP